MVKQQETLVEEARRLGISVKTLKDQKNRKKESAKVEEAVRHELRADLKHGIKRRLYNA